MTTVRKSITLPEELVKRLENAANKINVSAVCADAIDKTLTALGY